MRDVTNKILEMIDEGLLDPKTVALACLKYMSEDAVADMATANEFFEEEEEPEFEELTEEDLEALEEETHPYIINAGDAKDDLYPYLACESREKAIALCKNNKFYKYLEVVYMPEYDVDINEVVWRSWED